MRKSPPPFSEEHKQKLRESNKKTWSNPAKRAEHSKKTVEALTKMDPKKKKEWKRNVAKASRTEENKERARKLMARLREDSNFRKNLAIARSKVFKKEGNPFYGKKHTEETRRAISETKRTSEKTCRGKDNSAYIDGRSKQYKDKRKEFHQTLEYRLFREAVFKRDNFTCVLCGESPSGKLCVDHIKSYRYHPNLRTEKSNGRTLCIYCHRKTPNYGRKEEYEWKKYEKTL